VPIVGPVESVLTEMVATLKELAESPDKDSVATWWKQIEEWRAGGDLFPYNRGDGSVIKPQTVIETLCEVTKGDAYVTSDVGQHQMFAAQYYRFNKPNRWINSGGLGTMGFGLPAAMGVALSFPNDNVACVTGEGSIQMNIQELSTCLQYNLPVKIILLNNGVLGMVRQWQDMSYSGRHSHSYMESLPDFVKLVEAYGHVGMRITDLKDLKPKMEEAFAMKDRLVFLDIKIDVGEHVYPMQIRDGSMRDMWLSKTERT
jgi:acetolactate synthase-1/2/3 large subunit